MGYGVFQESGSAALLQLFAQSGIDTIKRSELAALLKQLDGSVFTDDNTSRLLDGFDADGNSSISAEAFFKWLFDERGGGDVSRLQSLIGSRHLILHFDVNKTLVMMDSVSSKTIDDVANSVMAASAWGVVDEAGSDSNAKRWRCMVAEPSIKRPSLEMVSYAEFMEEKMPGKEVKKERETYIHSFTKPGQPGEALQQHLHSFIAALRLPPEVIGTEAARQAGLNGDVVFIIPAFFELLLHLKRVNASFCILFRTFGKDLQEVVTEFNAFCEGKHPLYPGAIFDGRDGAADYRISFDDPLSFGTFFRASHCGEKDALVFGTLDQPKFDEGLAFYENADKFPHLEIVRGGLVGIHDKLRICTGKRCTLALRDYFPWWRRQDFGKDTKSLNGGKLMVLEPYSTSGLQSIFFDDNIAYDAARIVDVRMLSLPDKRISVEYLSTCHIVKAEPLEAVTDPAYFTRHVERLVAAYDRRLSVRKRMLALFVHAKKTNVLVHIARTSFSRAGVATTPVAYDPWMKRRRASLMYTQKTHHNNEEDEPEDVASPKVPVTHQSGVA